jgi:hypothetical protein
LNVPVKPYAAHLKIVAMERAVLGWLDFDGRWLARFRRWLDGQPDRSSSELPLHDKIGRLALASAFIVVISSALAWAFVQMTK